jgi:hypothetical protein
MSEHLMVKHHVSAEESQARNTALLCAVRCAVEKHVQTKLDAVQGGSIGRLRVFLDDPRQDPAKYVSLSVFIDEAMDAKPEHVALLTEIADSLAQSREVGANFTRNYKEDARKKEFQQDHENGFSLRARNAEILAKTIKGHLSPEAAEIIDAALEKARSTSATRY